MFKKKKKKGIMLSSIDSLEASFQSIEHAIHRMCGLFGRPESTTTGIAVVFDPVSSPPLAGDEGEGGAGPLSPLLTAEEERLDSLARRARSYADRLESCCQDLQEKYEQVAAIEQKLERSSVIWKVAIQKLTELSSAQRAQLAMLKSASTKGSQGSASLSPPPSSSFSTGSSSFSAIATAKGQGQKGGSTKKLKRRGSDTLRGRSESSSHITCRSSFDGGSPGNLEDETDDNLRNALEVMWTVERTKKDACEMPQPPLIPIGPEGDGSKAGGEGEVKLKVGLGKSGNDKGGNENEDDEYGDDDGDDIEQVSATILGNVVVLDEIMSEISSYTTTTIPTTLTTPRKAKSKRRGGDCAEDGGSGEVKRAVAMVDAAVQTDPLAPEQLRSLVDSMVLTPNQDQGCNVQ